MNRATITRDLIGVDFRDLWPKEARPVLVEFAPGVRVVNCIIANGMNTPDRAELLNWNREPIKYKGSSGIWAIYEPPRYVLLYWDESLEPTEEKP